MSTVVNLPMYHPPKLSGTAELITTSDEKLLTIAQWHLNWQSCAPRVASFVHIMAKVRRKVIQLTDKRVKAVTEVITGIK
eukprot:scaffold375418_cov27-Prasinocladus_malaysianus.AAC.1